MAPVTLAVTADLHLPMTSAEALAAMLREVEAHEPSVCVIAGDVGEGLDHFERCLAMVKRFLPCPVLVLAGNHDLWKRSTSSRRLWEDLLPQATRQAGCVWLEGDAFIHQGVAVAGTIAWYDYSAADPSIQASPQVFAREKCHFNVDAIMIDWEWSEPQFAAHVAEPFLATLDRLEADPAVRQTIVVTHVPLLECQMCRRPHDCDWGFSNAYFGNLTLGRQVLQRKKVTHIISGHTHIGREFRGEVENGRRIEAHVLASDYRKPAWLWVAC